MKISDLLERYKISRSALYKRLKAVDARLPKDKRGRLYATAEQLGILDDIHHHLTNGGRFCDYSPTITIDVVSEEDTLSTAQSTIQSTTQVGSENISPLTESLGKLARVIAASLQSASSVVKRNQDLQEVMNNGWLLTSNDVKAIAGQKPVRKGSDSCQIGGWRFVVVGKSGNRLLWKVERTL